MSNSNMRFAMSGTELWYGHTIHTGKKQGFGRYADDWSGHLEIQRSAQQQKRNRICRIHSINIHAHKAIAISLELVTYRPFLYYIRCSCCQTRPISAYSFYCIISYDIIHSVLTQYLYLYVRLRLWLCVDLSFGASSAILTFAHKLAHSHESKWEQSISNILKFMQ